MRSPAGAEKSCPSCSYLATATHRSMGWLDALTRALNGNPWISGTT
jgi:hypothetical protein